MSDIEALEADLKESDVPTLSEADVVEVEEIARGSYGVISKGKLKANRSRVVLKQMIPYKSDENYRKLFCKEIRILVKTTDKNAPNIVRLRGVCLEPLSAIEEYLEFSLDDTRFCEKKASVKGNNTLAHLLHFLHELTLVEEVGVKQRVLHKAAVDVATGLAFLHENDICHRDLKTSNVLATNSGKSFSFKLTDFGESRARDLQTASLHTSTDRVQRGTELYFAPEVFMDMLRSADIEDFKRVDIWAYGMILFCLLSPDLRWPWEKERIFPVIWKAMTDEKLPTASGQYKHLPGDTGLGEIYTTCCHYDPTGRPAINDVVNELTKNPKSKLLSIGKKKFNMDSKKGLEYLNDHGLLKNHTPEDIAEFLFNGEGLSKRAIGDYLGERDDFNIAVLKAFVNLHEFSDMLIVQALRPFLWSFRLPGEAQKIDRMMECFAQRYYALNPQHFSSTDTCYVLSFAIIMLNTSLHNPSVKDKPGVDRFIDMNRGINDGKDLPAELLTRVFDNIKKEPFKIPADDGDDLMHTFFNPDKEGWLRKKGGRYKSWKRRWFLLKDRCLYYFEFTQDKEPKGIIPLMNIQVREISDRDKPHCFELYSASSDFIKACKTNSEGKVVEGKHTVYRMSASSATEKEEWMKCIKSSIKSDTPFYSILQARRKKAQQE